MTWQKTETGSASVYYRTLSTKKIDNPKDEAHKTNANEETNQPATFSEVQSMMAGGVLVYAPDNAGCHWTLEQATELPNYEVDVDTMHLQFRILLRVQLLVRAIQVILPNQEKLL